MNIIKGTLFTQAINGRPTPQIPALVIGSEPEYEEVPDEWVMFLDSNNGLTDRPKSSYWYLSRKGFRANIKKIREAYEKGRPGRGENRTDWEYYLSNVLSWYDEIEILNEKKIRNLEKKLTTMKKLKDMFFFGS